MLIYKIQINRSPTNLIKNVTQGSRNQVQILRESAISGTKNVKESAFL